jgi:hypothetical protein
VKNVLLLPGNWTLPNGSIELKFVNTDGTYAFSVAYDNEEWYSAANPAFIPAIRRICAHFDGSIKLWLDHHDEPFKLTKSGPAALQFLYL